MAANDTYPLIGALLAGRLSMLDMSQWPKLREEVAALIAVHNDMCRQHADAVERNVKIINHRVAVEQRLIDIGNGKLAPPTAEDCAAMARVLGGVTDAF